jgi:hypothetical protein
VATRTFYTSGSSGPAPILNAILGGYGYHSGTCLPETIRSVSTMNNEQWFSRIWVPPGNPITKVGSFAIRTAGVVGAGGLNGFAIYSDDGTLLWSSATDNALWTVAGERTKPVTPSIAAQPTGTWYRVAMSVQGYSTPPGTIYANLGDAAVLSDLCSYRARYRGTSATTWPASINPATDLATTSGYMVPLYLG